MLPLWKYSATLQGRRPSSAHDKATIFATQRTTKVRPPLEDFYIPSWSRMPAFETSKAWPPSSLIRRRCAGCRTSSLLSDRGTASRSRRQCRNDGRMALWHPMALCLLPAGLLCCTSRTVCMVLPGASKSAVSSKDDRPHSGIECCQFQINCQGAWG